MAGIYSLCVELTSTVPPAKLFKVKVIDGHRLSPQVLPDIVTDSVIVEGDGGVGSIRQTNFVKSKEVPFSCVKDRLDMLDKEKMECKFTMIEGGGLGEKLEWSVYHVKVEPTGDGGSFFKIFNEYKTISGNDYTKEEMERAKKWMIGMFKPFEAYILANPHYD